MRCRFGTGEKIAWFFERSTAAAADERRPLDLDLFRSNKTENHHTTSLRMYNSLVERCFKDCVDSFRRKDMEPTEEKVRVFFFLSFFPFFFFFFSCEPFSYAHRKAIHRPKKTSSTVRHQVLRKVHEAQREDRAAIRRAFVAGGAADRSRDEKVIFFLSLFLTWFFSPSLPPPCN